MNSAGSRCPLLSICILNWNTKKLLRDCLVSIYNDSRKAEWEILVVDNASEDDSVSMVETEFPRVRLIVTRENLGFARGNNLALEQARGKYLLLLNSDTWVEPGAVAKLIAFMERHPKVGVAGPKLLNADGSLQLSCGVTPSLKTEIVNKLLLHNLFPFFKLGLWNHSEARAVGWVAGACFMVRRKVVEEVGPLDPEFFMCYEDLEWCMRIGRAGWKIFYYPRSRVLHLKGRSIQKDFRRILVVSQQSLFYLYQKHFSHAHLSILRLLTVLEMVLRFFIWAHLFLLFPGRRKEGRQRLHAYGEILFRSIAEKAYWAPLRISKE